MRRFRNRHNDTETALTNFALTFAKALLVFCVVLFLLINPQNGNDGVKPKAEYILTTGWTSEHGRYDVDIWSRLPDGTIVNYSNRESGVVFLERDDLGQDCDKTTNQGKPVNSCEEMVVIRGIVPGEYRLALHLFTANGSAATGVSVAPIEVQVKIDKINPTVKTVWKNVVILNLIRQEKVFLRFTVQADGTVTDFVTDGLPAIVYSNEGRHAVPSGSLDGPSEGMGR